MNLWEFIFKLGREDHNILKQIYGLRVFNKKHGFGIIMEIKKGRIYISYSDKPNCPYRYDEFARLFDNSFVDYLDIDLKNKLKSISYTLTDPYISIIFKIDDGELLSRHEIDYIFNKKAFELIGKYYEKHISDDKWYVLKAASNYRKAGLIEKAFDLTIIDNFAKSQFTRDTDFNKFTAAILNSHGACFREKGNLTEAEFFARKALQHHESFYPYNLLGAIYIEKGNFIEGDKLFQKAESIGANKKDITDEQIYFIKSIIKKAPKEIKKDISNYFYYKDPNRYIFLKQFI
jgi:tetratricopeptide (TPR) repeat protein